MRPLSALPTRTVALTFVIGAVSAFTFPGVLSPLTISYNSQNLGSRTIHKMSAQNEADNIQIIKDISSGAVKARRLYTFSEARKKARTYGFTKEEFIEYECAGSYQLPKNADEVWADKWTSWEDFLGVPLMYIEAKETAKELARTHGIKSEKEYLELKKSGTISDDELASRLPLRPDLYYKADWISWEDLLGC